jgi:hypothetical protein
MPSRSSINRRALPRRSSTKVANDSVDQNATLTNSFGNCEKGDSYLMALLGHSFTSHNYEVSATPCTESEAARAPSRGVAETLLHETAGRESSLWRFDRDACRCGLKLPCLWGM